MPNLTQMAKGHNIAIGESTALWLCFLVMGLSIPDTSTITAPGASCEVSAIVPCDTDTDCMEKNPQIDPDGFMGEQE